MRARFRLAPGVTVAQLRQWRLWAQEMGVEWTALEEITGPHVAVVAVLAYLRSMGAISSTDLATA